MYAKDTTNNTTRELTCTPTGELIVSVSGGISGGGGGSGTSNTTEATQLLVKTAVQNVDTNLGAKADAVATSDTGTFSLLALTKRGLQTLTDLAAKIPTLVSGRIPTDGSGVTQPISASSLPLPTGAATSANQTTLSTATGAPADSAATSDTGSFGLIALLKRGLQTATTIAGRLPTSLGNKTSANSLSVTVSSDQTAVATKVSRFKASNSFTRPADTTAYTIGDAITNSTASPAVLQITIPGAVNGQAYVITEAKVISSNKGATLPLFNLYLFPTTYTATNDNAALTIDQTTYESGGIVVALTEQSSVASYSRTVATGLNYVRALDTNDTKLYTTLQANNAYTPASGEKFTVVLYGYLL